jgi:probable phosphoglycerate mutase
MTVVVWMRHGTCDDGLCRPGSHARPGSPLTLAGSIEAELTARRLAERRWKPALVATSPLRRAHLTAAIVARALDTQLASPAAVFVEWQAPHCVLGLAPANYPPEYLAWRNQRDHQPHSALPGGESLRAFADRAIEADAVARVLAAKHGPILIVSHRLLIGAVAALRAGHRDPAVAFRLASDFRLPPAQLWAPPEENPHGRKPARPADLAT